MKKEEIRKIYKEKRNQEQDQKIKSQIIVNKITDTNIYKESKIIALYSSIKNEVDLNSLFLKAKKDNKIIVYPKVINDGEMVFIKVADLNELSPGKYSILEPLFAKEKILDKKEIDLMLVPGLCFDKFKNRLGYGKGYYDKYLKNSKIIKIGITYDSCIIGKLETNENDIKMDNIITEKEIY